MNSAPIAHERGAEAARSTRSGRGSTGFGLQSVRSPVRILASIPDRCGGVGGAEEADGTCALPTGAPAWIGRAAPDGEDSEADVAIGGEEEY